MQQLISYSSFKGFLKNRYVLSGLAVRFTISLFFAHMFDFGVLTNSARDFYYYGTITYFVEWPWGLFAYLVLLGSYLPAYLFPDYIFLFAQNLMIGEKFFLKLPLNISDLLISYTLYCVMVENNKKRWAMPLALLYWLNPLSIFVTSIHGTFDSLSILFSVFGFYHFLHRRYGLSGLEFGIGFGIKFQPVILVPLFLLVMWKEAKREIPKFLLYFGVTATLSFILPALIFYDPITHYWSFRFSISELAISEFRSTRQLLDANMTYRNLLLRCGYYGMVSYSTLIEVGTFAVLFLIFIFLVFRKRLFERYSQTRLEYLTACVITIYMIFYLSYGRIHQHYALWALPFLLIFFSFRDLNRFLLLTFNFIPLIQYFSRDSIFYYLNGSYTTLGVGWIAGMAAPYGVGFANGEAAGLLFSLSCVFILVSLFRDVVNIYQPFMKVHQFFNKISERKKTISLSLSLIFIFVLVVSSINNNGLYWSGYPITFFVPMEWIIIPPQIQHLMGYLLIFYLIPLSISLSASLHGHPSEPDKNRWKNWKLAILLILILGSIILGYIILSATLPYVATGNGFFFGWVPVFGILRVLCEHGGIIMTCLILISSVLTLDLLSKPVVSNTVKVNSIALKT